MNETAALHFVLAHPLLAIAVIFLLDGLGLPLVPEVAALAAFAADPSLGWGLILLGIILAMEVGAAVLLYAITYLFGVPPVMARLMRGYSGHMLVHDERLLLLNRVVPVLPVAGAFIHVNGWRPLRSFSFIALGCTAKYGLLFSGSHLAYQYFSGPWALATSLGLAGLFLGVSGAFTARSWWVQRKAAAAVRPAS